jgi:hypothetical protein
VPSGDNLPRFQQVQLDFAAHIRHPELHPAPAEVEPRRMQVYVDLFFDNVRGFLEGTFPVAHSILPRDAWRSLVRDFVHRHRCTSPYFLEIPVEFLEFLLKEREHPQDPPWLVELCHYEWVELALDVDDTPLPVDGVAPDGDLLEGRPVVSPQVRNLTYRWPVHQLAPDRVPEAPPDTATHLLVHRDRAEAVRFMETNPFTTRLITLLEDGTRTGLEALTQLAREMDAPAETVLRHGPPLLEDLRGRDVLLGTRSP